MTSERNAVRDIKVAVPDDLVDNPTAGPVIRDYLRTLVNNWKTANGSMAADSYGEENFEVFRHGNLLSAVFHEDYHADGPKPNNAYRTFTFDMVGGRRVQLADLTTSNPLTALPHWRSRSSKPRSTKRRRHTTREPIPSPSTAGRPTRSTRGVQGVGGDARRADPVHARLSGGPRRAAQFHARRHAVVHGRGTVQAHIPLSALSSVLRV